MPTHTILGATGNVGSVILRRLLSAQIPDLRINILVRSKSKLLEAFPQLETTTSPIITIFESAISNEDTLKACIEGASTIYVCVATNHASRKVDIAVTTAASLVAALGRLRSDQGSEYKKPVVLFNRSMSLNSDIKMPIPDFMKNFTLFALWAIYGDLLRAGALYMTAEKDGLLTLITADAPGLMDPVGTEGTGYKFILTGKVSAGVNYADFGNALVELGQRHEEFGGKVVGVGATGKVRFVVWDNVVIILLGLRSRLSPF